MGSPGDVVGRIEAILQEKNTNDVQTLIAISKELGDVNYLNEWTPRDAACWSTRPESKREVELHKFIQDQGRQEGIKWGFFAGAGVVAFLWAIWGVGG
jgi:hypothetical protein